MAVELGYDGLIPYYYFDGASYYIPPDAHGVITGTESYVPAAQRGLTLGCWIKPTTTGEQYFISKFNQGVAGSYFLKLSASTKPEFTVYQSGVATDTVAADDALSTNTWYFVVGRWSTTSQETFVDDVKKSESTSVTQIDNASYLIFGAVLSSGSPTAYLTGYMAYPFLYACSLSDAQIEHLWQTQRVLFGK
jgi:hypothetical protein